MLSYGSLVLVTNISVNYACTSMQILEINMKTYSAEIRMETRPKI